ncbi:phosphate/phosphite/phosphonate ABC transporter substrate-binding protein [Pacificispira sp.]|uniref:phosphate/phosphite/phosphonate ABC transporter substrate-binding protein n=1 Tax=Pacificispira sp. TaxID=2888761 RepID=UPI003BAC8502
MKRFLTSVAAALTAGLVSTSAMAQDYNPDTLRIALLPDENAATVIQDNKPLQDYLATALGKEIELVVTTDYSSMIEATRFGRIDIAYFGPASYTIAKDRMAGGDLDIEPFAARLKDGSTTYQSVLIAGKDTGLTALDQIKGSGINVAFGDQASTSSHFAPKYTLMKAGIMPSEDYSENFTGAHDAVARNVELGNAEVGGLSRPIFERLIQKGTIDGDKIVVLGYSDSIPQYPWVMRSDMAPELKTAIVDAFLSLKKGTPDGDSVLKPFKADGFAAIRDSDYDIIRAIRQNVQGE